MIPIGNIEPVVLGHIEGDWCGEAVHAAALGEAVDYLDQFKVFVQFEDAVVSRISQKQIATSGYSQIPWFPKGSRLQGGSVDNPL